MVLFIGVRAQVVFTETFDSATKDSLPTGWTKFNLDGNTPNSSLTGCESFDKAWGCYNLSTDCGVSYGSMAAWTTSWFSSAATANRWMFTPAITIPANNPCVQWIEFTPEAAYADGYMLYVICYNNCTNCF